MADYSEIKSLAMEVNAAFPDKEDLWNMVCTPSVALHLVADIERLKAENEALRKALGDILELYDTDEGCKNLPQYIAGCNAMGKGEQS
ncbi:hypothetical protein P2T68_16995 [Pseudomonas sp. G11]|uniref:hypothetical protein n=1 Tax=Pseudomonas sp. G11 TaxID=528343 RepID=UPI0024027FF7|nr:hypothetical protein [Pseudomonas sp. G11]WEX18942.1 hypothetical protein P2T68_16995 [Pseudomonas sp. G11]